MTNGQKQEVDGNDFAKQVEGASRGFFAEFWSLLWHTKKWWLAPVLLLLLVLGTMVILGGTAAAPLIYTLF
jgi:uncharacterized protein DUF5989